MEPITTALVAALGKLAEPAVKDAYEGLKALIMKKAPQLLAMIQDVAQSPEALKAMLTQAIKPK